MTLFGVVVCTQPGQPPPPFPAPQTTTRKADNGPISLFPVQTVWTLPLNQQLAFRPAYDEASGYFTLDDHRIVAYDLLPGKRKWIVDAHPLFAPVTGDGLLFLAESDALTALRCTDGTVAWQLPFAEALSVHPVWANGWLIAATRRGTVVAVRASDGKRIWSRDIGSPAHAPPALAADHVYVPTDDRRVVALRVDTGEPLWQRTLGGPPDEILALENRLYVGSENNFFYALLTKDGVVDWRWRTGGDIVGMPLADDRRVYFVALDNILRALALDSGVQHWMRPLPLRPMAGPVRAGGTIIVAGLTPPIRGYNVADGVAAGELEAGPEVAAPPHVVVDSATAAPFLLYMTKDIASGATATLVTRSFEPAIAPVAPLPDLVTISPPK